MLGIVSRVNEYVEDRRYMGEMAQPTAIGYSSLDGQPPRTTLYLRIENGVVRDGRFQTSGCGYLIASCGALIELARGRSLADCRTLNEPSIIEHLGGLPEPRRYCASLAIAALRDAIGSLDLSEAKETGS